VHRVRTYGQFCAVAKALDVVGDRWTLLVVRELLIRGPSRYTDLRRGLPGIATNLLADRLRELEAAGLVAAEQAPPPVAATLFALTDRGAELEPVLQQLAKWGGALLGAPTEGEAFQSHWFALPLRRLLADHAPDHPAQTLEVCTGDEPLTVTVGGGAVDPCPGPAVAPDAVVEGPPELVIPLLAGWLTLAAARAAGLAFRGDAAVLARVQPGAAG
jgi:DNA-binding HxlR family transcriptional regulator